jgi:citrate lyase beta subunit
LFISQFEEDTFATAINCGADIVVLDIEDETTLFSKENTRDRVCAFVNNRQKEINAEISIRINKLMCLAGMRDMLEIIENDITIDSLILPKIETAEEVVWVDKLLLEAGLSIEIHAVIEGNKGLRNVYEIATATPRLTALFFGGFDMSAALGVEMAWQPLAYARARTVHAAALAEIDALDSPFPDVEDERGLVDSAVAAREFGFVGKSAKDPRQVHSINESFSPDKTTIETARRISQSHETTPAGDVIVDGRIIDKQKVRYMARVLAIAEREGLI